MRTKLWMVAGAAAMWACGGTTFTGPSDGGAEGSSSSSSGGGGSSSSSGGSSSSSGASGSSGSSGSTGSGGGSGSSSGGSGSSSGGSNPTCPLMAPYGGTACPVVGMECEYGNNPNPQCNEIETCQSNYLWSYPPPGPACPPGTCPATYADVPQGKSCTPQGLDCSYPEGQCNCAPTLPTSGPNPVWQCIQPGAGCPEPRPDIGSACTQPLSCDYGSCTGGVELQCTDGSWRVVQTPCPV